MAYVDQKGYIRLEQEDEETFGEVRSHFTPNGYKPSQWVVNIIKWLTEDLNEK